MNDLPALLHREAVYLWYYFTVQLEQILGWWVLGMLVGSAVSVFAKDAIRRALLSLRGGRAGALGIAAASALGIASPLCMYGTIPIAASLSRSGMRDDWLAAFMMSSILLNPQLLLYSAALGGAMLAVRLLSCFLCGVAAGALVRALCKKKSFFDFRGFAEPENRDTDPNLLRRYGKNLWRNVRATAGFFFLGVLMAATVGVPLYACGGGTIPLLQQWLLDGMRPGSAAAFLLTGPSTKITNLGALKIVLGWKHFLLYLAFVMGFSLAAGLIVNAIL